MLVVRSLARKQWKRKKRQRGRDNKRWWKPQRRWRGVKKGTSGSIKEREGARTTTAVARRRPRVFAPRRVNDNNHRHVGTPRLFSFGPRPRIPWKIISCVNGRLVLHGGFFAHFSFLAERPSPPFFLPFIGRPATPLRLRKETAFS